MNTFRAFGKTFTGVLVARTEWINGCVRLTIQPREMKDGKRIDNDTFDIEQCELVEEGKTKVAKRSGGERQNIGRGEDVL